MRTLILARITRKIAKEISQLIFDVSLRIFGVLFMIKLFEAIWLIVENKKH